MYYITTQFNILTQKIMENLIEIFRHKLKKLFFYKKKISNITIESILTQKKTKIKLFTGLILKYSKTDKIKFLEYPIFITEEFITQVLQKNNTISSNNGTFDLDTINQSECLKLIKVMKAKKINCLIFSKKFNEFLYYYLNLSKIMIITSERLTDFIRIKALTFTKVIYMCL